MLWRSSRSSPTDGKNAVLTGTVDTCIHGIAAFILGAAAGEPVMIVANANNRGMAVMAGVNSNININLDGNVAGRVDAHANVGLAIPSYVFATPALERRRWPCRCHTAAAPIGGHDLIGTLVDSVYARRRAQRFPQSVSAISNRRPRCLEHGRSQRNDLHD